MCVAVFFSMTANVLFTQLNPTFVNAAFITCVNQFSVSFELNMYVLVYECLMMRILNNIIISLRRFALFTKFASV